MIKNLTISVLPSEAAEERSYERYIAEEAGVQAKRITGFHITKRSIDARSRQPRVVT